MRKKNTLIINKKLKEIEELENQFKITTIELNEEKENSKKTREELSSLKIIDKKNTSVLSRAAI